MNGLQVLQANRLGLLGPASLVQALHADLRVGAQVEDDVQVAVVVGRHPVEPLVENLVLSAL